MTSSQLIFNLMISSLTLPHPPTSQVVRTLFQSPLTRTGNLFTESVAPGPHGVNRSPSVSGASSPASDLDSLSDGIAKVRPGWGRLCDADDGRYKCPGMKIDAWSSMVLPCGCQPIPLFVLSKAIPHPQTPLAIRAWWTSSTGKEGDL